MHVKDTSTMSIRGQKRIVAIAGPAILLTIVTVIFFAHSLPSLSPNIQRWTSDSSSSNLYKQTSDFFSSRIPKSFRADYFAKQVTWDISRTHHEIFSVSTQDKRYFPMTFAPHEAMNPNIIPHPNRPDTWIMIAQQQKSAIQHSVWFAEFVCDAIFTNDILHCIAPPTIAPIAATYSQHCTGDVSFFQNNVGPHDARVSYGPKAPYIIFGSQSSFNCFGQWIQDFRMLYDWGYELIPNNEFKRPTDLQRPLPYHAVEKNYFLFWDTAGHAHAHYDIYPERVFAKLEFDGSAGPNIASHSYPNDKKCMDRYMPALAPSLESIHQATNSLSITLCKRHDPTCMPSELNTFIFTIFQHKSFYSYHSVYEPYVMMFKQNAPFDVHAISKKTLWIHGRGKWRGHADMQLTEEEKGNQTEMFYVTSMSWKQAGLKYHGYIDDVLFLAFGIEDERTAGIDVLAGELVRGMGVCSEV